MTSGKLHTDLKYTYDGEGISWTIWKNDVVFAVIYSAEKDVIYIVSLLNDKKEDAE